MSRIAMCGWESGHREECGTLVEVASGVVSVVSSSSRNGAYAMQSAVGSGGSSAARVSVNAPTNPAELYVRLGYRHESVGELHQLRGAAAKRRIRLGPERDHPGVRMAG